MMGIPRSIMESLVGYVSERIPVGGFLEAVISNDLKESFARADMESRAALFEIVFWLYNEAPSTCWGSPEKYRNWIARAG